MVLVFPYEQETQANDLEIFICDGDYKTSDA
jgi:hypothetical protein